MSDSEIVQFEFKRYIWNHPERQRAKNKSKYEVKQAIQKVDEIDEDNLNPLPLIGPGGVLEVIGRKEYKKQHTKTVETTRPVNRINSRKTISVRRLSISPVTERPRILQPSPEKEINRQKTPMEQHTENTQRILLIGSQFV